MKETSPEYRFMNDPQYRRIVDMLINLIETSATSPSELREMAMFACIHYEMTHVRRHILYEDVATENKGDGVRKPD